MNDCLFCKIINKEIPSKIIYEDEVVQVFLDIKPSTNGDSLLIPKKHIVTIDEVDNELMNHFLMVIKKLKPIYEEKLNCEGLTLIQNNGHGQEIKHFHIHLTPRYINDELEHKYNKEDLISLEEIHNILTK